MESACILGLRAAGVGRMREDVKRCAFVFLMVATAMASAARLPEAVVFVGKDKLQRLVDKGVAENWAALPIGDRTAKVGMALRGTPYKNFTLELSATVEDPSVNMAGMDCWTFFEISLAVARGLKTHGKPTSEDILKLIERDRYRGGRCNGVFTSRLHYLEQWLADNQSRGLVTDATPQLPGAKRLYRAMKEMSAAWKSYRQLRANPSLVPEMERVESQLADRGIWYVPKSRAPGAEPFIRSGDIVCIVSTWPRSYTSHVGLAYRDNSGVLRFLHASKNLGEVTLDSRLSDYLNKYSMDAGIMVARPKDL